jgi:hypothetical protein
MGSDVSSSRRAKVDAERLKELRKNYTPDECFEESPFNVVNECLDEIERQQKEIERLTRWQAGAIKELTYIDCYECIAQSRCNKNKPDLSCGQSIITALNREFI